MIEGVFAPARFLELVRDFVLFEIRRGEDVEGDGEVPPGATPSTQPWSRWRLRSADDRRGGLVWHTQGAGKSYTMVFFANKLRRDARFANPTVVAVTDRTDLDNQLAETFTAHAPRERGASRQRRSPAVRRACTSC